MSKVKAVLTLYVPAYSSGTLSNSPTTYKVPDHQLFHQQTKVDLFLSKNKQKQHHLHLVYLIILKI